MSMNGLERWLLSPAGDYVIGWERERFDVMVADVFGYNALQLGLPQFDLLAENRIPLRQKAGAATASGAVDVLCDLRQLPFSANSIDLIVMPHILEFHDEPHQVLREVERILIPEGQLILSGFNPLSLWGLCRKLRGRDAGFPWDGHYLSVQRVKDWMQLLGFEVDRGNFGCYAPPFSDARWIEHSRFMEAAGDRWWSFAGGVYVLRAIKRLHGMRLIMPAWQPRKASRKALSAITQEENQLREH